MAEKKPLVKFYLPENPDQAVPLLAGDVLCYDEGVGFVSRAGHVLLCANDAETTEFEMHNVGHKSLVHFALDLAESYGLSVCIRTPTLGGEKEWLLGKLGSD